MTINAITNLLGGTKPVADGISPLPRLWLLRMLIGLGLHRAFIQSDGFKDDELARALGLGEWIADGERDFIPKAVRAQLRALHAQAERLIPQPVSGDLLRANIERLAGLVGLTVTDCQILEFAVLIHNERLLDDTADWLGSLSTANVLNALSVILALPLEQVRAALSAEGALTRCGLVTLDRSGTAFLRAKLSLLSDSFADYMASSQADPILFLKEAVCRSAPATLEFHHYTHLTASLAIVRPYLKRSLKKGRCGVNIFLYGDPGTGKTELARLLAQDAGCTLFDVANEDDEGDPISGGRRLRAFRAAQSFLAKRGAMILFDEVEDVFNDGELSFGRKSTAQMRKAWINRMLEENPVPTFWVSNSISCVDPAFIRRFDMVIELPVPPRSQRAALIEAVCADLITPAVARGIAESDVLAPAVIARAASVVRCIRRDLKEGEAPGAIVQLVSGTLQAQGHGRLKTQAARLPDDYDPAYIRGDVDLVALAQGLKTHKDARLCLYGPPGTGKTAFGHWLAQQLEMPLHLKRGSDLLGRYVGETEQNIARAFDQARSDQAMLMIDEVDGFLQERRAAQRSWEITAVNEMLTQMESFAGVFVASTNLMDKLDQAALRRFDLKVRFDYLDAGQAWQLFVCQCELLGLAPPAPELAPRLRQLPSLTPGDFAVAVRQHRFQPIGHASALLERLAAECKAKLQAHANRIGFV